jgi:hypothetical protein
MCYYFTHFLKISGCVACSVADPESGAFLTPGSGIRDPEWVFSGSRIPRPFFEELFVNFFGKKF